MGAAPCQALGIRVGQFGAEAFESLPQLFELQHAVAARVDNVKLTAEGVNRRVPVRVDEPLPQPLRARCRR